MRKWCAVSVQRTIYNHRHNTVTCHSKRIFVSLILDFNFEQKTNGACIFTEIIILIGSRWWTLYTVRDCCICAPHLSLSYVCVVCTTVNVHAPNETQTRVTSEKNGLSLVYRAPYTLHTNAHHSKLHVSLLLLLLNSVLMFSVSIACPIICEPVVNDRINVHI